MPQAIFAGTGSAVVATTSLNSILIIHTLVSVVILGFAQRRAGKSAV
jgi:hypothetical protein